jgi:hypothetical protein
MRPRFSLRTVILMMAIAALALVVWRQYVEVEPLREEVGQLRADAGILTLTDRERMAVAYVPSLDVPFTWKWRIYLPEKRTFKAYLAADRIPESGRPKNVSTSIPGGEYLLTVAIREQKEKQWTVLARFEPEADSKLRIQTLGYGIHPTSDWLEGQRSVHMDGVVDRRKQYDFPVDQPLELLRMRAMSFTPKYPNSTDPVHQNVGTTTVAPGLADGFLLWIEEDPLSALNSSGKSP